MPTVFEFDGRAYEAVVIGNIDSWQRRHWQSVKHIMWERETVAICGAEAEVESRPPEVAENEWEAMLVSRPWCAACVHKLVKLGKLGQQLEQERQAHREGR